jgi:hypothetical protein
MFASEQREKEQKIIACFLAFKKMDQPECCWKRKLMASRAEMETEHKNIEVFHLSFHPHKRRKSGSGQ